MVAISLEPLGDKNLCLHKKWHSSKKEKVKTEMCGGEQIVDNDSESCHTPVFQYRYVDIPFSRWWTLKEENQCLYGLNAANAAHLWQKSPEILTLANSKSSAKIAEITALLT